MADYLTSFANTLEEFFNCLSEFGLVTRYTVQLQSTLSGSETTVKVRIIIQELIEKLQKLLSSIPNKGSSEASTQTVDETSEVIVTCYPHNFANITNAQTVESCDEEFTEICNEEIEMGNSPENTVNSVNSPANTSFETVSTAVVSSIKICELKPFIIGTNKNFTKLISLQPTSNEDSNKVAVDNIVHFVMEGSCRDPRPAIKEISRNADNLPCNEHDVKFESPEELGDYMKAGVVKNLPSYTCDQCNNVFNCVQSLQEHCRKQHGGAGCFVCTICKKRFMTKLSHNRHMDLHEGKTEAKCNLCAKSFSRTDYLQTHYSIHLGKRNFACSQCPRKFVRRVHLKVHEKTHSGVKDYICNVCSKGFARNDKLKEHMLRHLNIKRFQCSTCQKGYAEKRDLKIHLKTHKKK